ncbi:MAG TPA: hypothetical protein VII06_13370 [Chloroflexota bacterium]|jgi:hypothetical protein
MVEDDTPPDLEAEDFEADLPPAPEGAVHCRVCTILIGPGYVESEPIPDPEGRGGYVCWRCFESLQRQAERKARAERLGQAPPPENPVRRFRRR